MADETAPPAPQTNAQPASPALGAPPAAQSAAAPRNPVLASALPESALLAKKQKWQEEARAQALRELGIEDPEAWRAEQAQLREQADAKKRADDEAARAKLDEKGRYEADLSAAKSRIAELEKERDAKAKEALTKGVELLAREAAVETIDPAMYPYARTALREHIAALPERERRRFDDDDAKEFFKKLAKEKPGFAKRVTAPVKPGAPPLRRPLTNGAPPARTTVPAGTQPKTPDATGAKTAAPGKPNSMSNEEVAQLTETKFGFKYRPYGGGARASGRANGAANGTPGLGATAANGARPAK